MACHSAADRCNAPACAQPRATQICLVFAESCNTCYSLRVFLCGCAEQILKKRGGALHTSFELDTTGAGLFKAYENTSDNTLDMTFNVKDFAVIAQLCKVMSADIVLHVNACGNPLVAKAAWPDAEDSPLSDCVAAELLVATILESVQVQLSLVHCHIVAAQITGSCALFLARYGVHRAKFDWFPPWFLSPWQGTQTGIDQPMIA